MAATLLPYSFWRLFTEPNPNKVEVLKMSSSTTLPIHPLFASQNNWIIFDFFSFLFLSFVFHFALVLAAIEKRAARGLLRMVFVFSFCAAVFAMHWLPRLASSSVTANKQTHANNIVVKERNDFNFETARYAYDNKRRRIETRVQSRLPTTTSKSTATNEWAEWKIQKKKKIDGTTH